MSTTMSGATMNATTTVAPKGPLDNHILQAFIGTLITYAANAFGAALVFVFWKCNCLNNRKILDVSLGFAGGVMVAASFWSLIAPGIASAESSEIYGKRGEFAFAPVALGLILGSGFVLFCDWIIPRVSESSNPGIALAYEVESDKDDLVVGYSEQQGVSVEDSAEKKRQSWKRIVLLIIAMTVHNIPEGLGVGVAFGAIGSAPEFTFASARNLCIAMCFQNMPEGLAVSVPLCAAGFTPLKSFWYGQLSGIVEPLFGILGALFTTIGVHVSPYALSFAGGAMIYVVVDDLIPEAYMHGNGRGAAIGFMVGFIIMMCLDVGLGKI